MTKQQRADLRAEIAELRALVLAETAAIKQRLDALEKPRIARVVVDPSRTEPGGEPRR
jgi:hypothetical protein